MQTLMLTLSRWLVIALLLGVAGCSIPPAKKITIDELMSTRVFRIYKIDESPEDVLRVLNRDGEVIVKGERTVRNTTIPVHVKILATSKGMEISDYER